MLFFYEFAAYYAPELNKPVQYPWDNPTYIGVLPDLFNYTSAELAQPNAPQHGNSQGGGYHQGTYTPARLVGGIKHGAINENSEKSAGALTLDVLRSFPIAQLFQYGAPAATLYLRVLVADDADAEKLAIFVGRVRSCEFGDLTAKLTAQPIMDTLQKPGLSQRFSRACPFALYDPNTCGANKASFRVQGTVDSISDDGLTIASSAFATKPADWLAAGFIEFGEPATGNKQLMRQRRAILTHSSDTVQLISPVNGLQIGEYFDAYKGCTKTTDSCNSFSNLPNFGGFPYIPLKNVFTTGIK